MPWLLCPDAISSRMSLLCRPISTVAEMSPTSPHSCRQLAADSTQSSLTSAPSQVLTSEWVELSLPETALSQDTQIRTIHGLESGSAAVGLFCEGGMSWQGSPSPSLMRQVRKRRERRQQSKHGQHWSIYSTSETSLVMGVTSIYTLARYTICMTDYIIAE